MKQLLLSATAIGLLGSMLVLPAIADDASRKGPPKTMGDEGTLPTTKTIGSHVPSMGAEPAEPGTAPLTPKGPQATMGDEGKLPATSTGSGRVPDMTGPAEK
jgi:hypothetical protein